MDLLKLLDYDHSIAGEKLKKFVNPWEAIPHIGEYIEEISKSLGGDYREISKGVFVHKSAKIAPSASISAPCIIGEGTEVRHCAFIRGNALVGAGCVVGNSTELKNVILFDGVQVPHYNYVGDSILGYKAHMGAGSITSNVKSDKTLVTVKIDGNRVETGLKKFGAVLGDFTEVGCNSVLNPGTVTGRHVTIYPLSCVRGAVEENCILKNDGTLVKKR